MRVCMSGVGWGYWRDADVRGDFVVLEAEGGSWVEMAGSSGMPGCGACSLVQARPA